MSLLSQQGRHDPLDESDDGNLHLWECAHLLRNAHPDYDRCLYLSKHPGVCPYDHGEEVQLTPLIAVVLCSDCGTPIPVDEGRAPDDRRICGNCSMAYIGKYPEDDRA